MEKKAAEALVEDQGDRSQRVAWGAGRVIFRANLTEIQDQLNNGWPMSTVYERLKDSLGGLSYRAFTKLVTKYFGQTAGQTIRKYEVVTPRSPSAGLPRIAESTTQREQTNDKKATTPGKPAKFRPGPRIPDPRDLY